MFFGLESNTLYIYDFPLVLCIYDHFHVLKKVHNIFHIHKLYYNIHKIDYTYALILNFHKNNFHHTLEVLDNVSKKTDNLWLRWAAFLHDVGKPKSKRWDPLVGWTFHNHNAIGAKMVPEIFKRLKLPLDSKMKYVQNLVELHMRPIVIADEEVTDSAVRRLLNDAGDDIDDLMLLCEADITSKNQIRKQRFLDNFITVREKLADLKEKDYKRLFQPCVDGNEIMEMFGLSQGKVVGDLKKYIKDAVLDGKVENNPEELRKMLCEKYQQLKESGAA